MTDISPLLELMERLRDPEGGCPWDRAQTFATISPYTVEEAYEVADAIARDDMADLASELGDLLFHIAFHAQMAKEAGLFDFEKVLSGIVEKMTRRHPHVFAGKKTEDMATLYADWEAQKAAERGGNKPETSLMDQVTKGLPAMRRAVKLQKKAAQVGLDWAGPVPVLEKLQEDLRRMENDIGKNDNGDAARAGIGDILFTCVNLARHLDVDPDGALREANVAFESRFRRMEEMSISEGSSIDTGNREASDALWEQIKSKQLPSDNHT
uniref:ATP diphosphatase n=1 Tax=Candidatus Kentrum sp. FW TaxID=2126338 RepID=A0A450RT13_9GAMM|nr:MAG: ATP diphosphatase [Candidatus Kentron sp. FW]